MMEARGPLRSLSNLDQGLVFLGGDAQKGQIWWLPQKNRPGPTRSGGSGVCVDYGEYCRCGALLVRGEGRRMASAVGAPEADRLNELRNAGLRQRPTRSYAVQPLSGKISQEIIEVRATLSLRDLMFLLEMIKLGFTRKMVLSKGLKHDAGGNDNKIQVFNGVDGEEDNGWIGVVG
jgi:hypothetical protein